MKTLLFALLGLWCVMSPDCVLNSTQGAYSGAVQMRDAMRAVSR